MDTENVGHPAANFVHIFEKTHIPGLQEQWKKRLEWENFVKEEHQKRNELKRLRRDARMTIPIRIMCVLYFSILSFAVWKVIDNSFISGCSLDEHSYSGCKMIFLGTDLFCALFLTLGWIPCLFVGGLLSWCSNKLRGIPDPPKIPKVDIPEFKDTITPAMIVKFQEIERIAWLISLREQTITFSQAYQLQMVFPINTQTPKVVITFQTTKDLPIVTELVRTFTYEPLDKAIFHN